MINRLLEQLTLKRIIIYLVIVIVAIYVVWYVTGALEGLNPNYQPMRPASGHSPKGGNEFFDPANKTPEVLSVKSMSRGE